MDDDAGNFGVTKILIRTQVVREDGETETMASSTVTAGLSPQHKAAVVLFLERVYGVQDQITFYRLLENGFLPDLRAATTLEEV